MVIAIIFFAGLVCVAGIVLVANPTYLMRMLAGYSDALVLHALAVVVRLLLGVALVLSAEASRFPAIIHVLGWISIVAAVVLAAIGRERFTALMRWATTQLVPFGRVAGVFAVAFGAFVIYAFLPQVAGA